MTDAALEDVKRFWETLTPQSVATLERAYTEDAYFRDPFNEVRGTPALKRIFGHMFETLHEPRFTIVESVREGERAFLVWDFDFRMKSWKPDVARRIRGTSQLVFAPDGRVCHHRDYWDSGDLYAMLPAIGPVIRWLARKLGVGDRKAERKF